MTKERETQVLVVGAGPVGLLAAALLAEHEIDVEIVDEAGRPATHGYALALHSRSLELLDELGVAEELIARGTRIDAVACFEGSEEMARIDLSRVSAKFPYVVALPQQLLESVLQERLRLRGVKIHWNQRVADVQRQNGSVLASIDHLDRVSGGYPIATKSQVVVSQHRTRCAFVIGADGSKSLVRRKLEAELEPLGEPFRCGVFEFSTGLTVPNEMRVVMGGSTCSGLWPLPDGRCRWTFELPGPAAQKPQRRGEARAVTTIGQRAYPEIALARLEELVAARAPWFDLEVGELFWSIEVGFERRLASKLGQGPIWIAGDAAHLMFPLGMHSMNSGFEEVARLTAAMADKLRGTVSDSIFASYESDRLEDLRLLVESERAVRPTSATDPWVAQHFARLVECLPACGDELVQLLPQLALERVTAGS